jgi:hypothetical protein
VGLFVLPILFVVGGSVVRLVFSPLPTIFVRGKEIG